MAKYFKNCDYVLQAVLADEKLIERAEYNPAEYETVDEALCSDNAIVNAVAKVINGKENKSSDKEIYNDVTNYLKNNLL